MYFDWKKMPFRPAPGGEHVPAVVVGAGPIGLAMAQALARQGIRSIVLEARDQVSDGSRAIALTRRTMQIFDALDVGEAVLAKASVWDLNAVYYGERPIYEMQLAQPASEKHKMTNLQQCWVEQIFLDRLAADGLAEVRWHSEVVGLEQRNDAVHLTVRRPDGSEYAFTADYVVAADGARGTIRKLAGMEYEGKRFEQRFVITDYHMKSDQVIGRRVWFSPPYAPGTTVLQHGGPFDIWRLDYQLRADEDPEQELKPERIRQRLEAHLRMVGETAPYEILWTSIYRANAISLPAYHQGRVLFIGDAAHQIPIFGGRGINNGFMDVMNLAWKLGYVLHKRASNTLLATYTDERRTAILQTIEDLTKVTLYMTTPSPAVQLMRDAVLSLSLTERFVHKLFDPFHLPPYAIIPIASSAALQEADAVFDGGPTLGQVVPDLPFPNANGTAPARLLDHIGGDFACLAWGGTPKADQRVAQLFATLQDAGFPLRCLAIGADLALHGAHRSITSDLATGLFHAAPGTVYLVRPDHHVAGRWTHVDPAAVAQTLCQALGIDTADNRMEVVQDVA
jgi:3-(3-hydroxy-phenyl)propionate hydroxylase